MMIKDIMLDKAKSAKREANYVEFKEGFDVNSPRDWCETIKDIVAMANSGGGIILFGVRNDGTPSDFNVSLVPNLDPAQLTDRIAKYTGEQFSNFGITEIERNGHRVTLLLIYEVSIPMVFIKPGTYSVGGGKQEMAFGRGTVYFQHGAKSEPGNSNDIRKVIEREVERIRKSWLGNIRKVVKAPLGHTVQVLPPEVRVSIHPAATPIRIVDEPAAPAYRLETPDITHPHRQKEVIELINQRLGGGKIINSYDVLSVRRVYEIDGTKPQYCYNPKFGSPQYSDDFINWLIQRYEEDSLFFEKAREEYRRLKK
jgi:hypothetical protein